MSSKEEEVPHEYVARVQRETREYMQGLIRENKRFRDLAASLNKEVSELRGEVDSLRSEKGQLESQLTDAEEASRQLSSRYIDVEQHINNLAQLYVASYKLNATIDHDEILKVLQEILINLIGTEEYVIYERPFDGGELDLAASYGVDSGRAATVDLTSGPLGEACRDGKVYQGDPTKEGDLLACVPLRVGSEVHGVIAVFGLLSHKPALDPVDLELFDLLANHAGTSLYLSQLHQSHTMT